MLSVSAEEGADRCEPNCTQEENVTAYCPGSSGSYRKFIYFILNISDEEQSAHNVTDVVVLKAKTFQINLGASYLQLTLDLSSHSITDHAHTSAYKYLS